MGWFISASAEIFSQSGAFVSIFPVRNTPGPSGRGPGFGIEERRLLDLPANPILSSGVEKGYPDWAVFFERKVCSGG
jgi:hypothetical protein